MNKEVIPPKEILLRQERELREVVEPYSYSELVKTVDRWSERLLKIFEKLEPLRNFVGDAFAEAKSMFSTDKFTPQEREKYFVSAYETAEEAEQELKKITEETFPLSRELEGWLEGKPEEEIQKIFEIFNERFQIEIFLSTLTWRFPKGNQEHEIVDLRRVFNDVAMGDQMIKKIFKKKMKDAKNCPNISLELLLHEDLDIEEIRQLEEEYNIKVTSVHWRSKSMKGGLLGKFFDRTLKEFQSDHHSRKIREIALALNVPVTVHVEELEELAGKGLLEGLDVRVENMAWDPKLSEEEIEKYCDPEKAHQLAKKCKFNLLNFDVQHFQRWQHYLKQRGILQEMGIDLAKNPNSFFNQTLGRVKNFVNKLHLSAGLDVGTGLGQRHLSVRRKGALDLKSFLQNYNFLKNCKNLLSLEINMTEVLANSYRTRRYYAQDCIFVLLNLFKNIEKELKEEKPNSEAD